VSRTRKRRVPRARAARTIDPEVIKVATWLSMSGYHGAALSKTTYTPETLVAMDRRMRELDFPTAPLWDRLVHEARIALGVHAKCPTCGQPIPYAGRG
jgi:hypothetical protein